MKKMKNKYVKIENNRFIVDLMYARCDNMVGRAVYQEIGWGSEAVLHVDMAERIYELVKVLEKEKLRLKIFDAYRPKIAHDIMKKIIPFKGFFAEEALISQHCLGTAVDVCLCDDEGKEFCYPTKVDGYEKRFVELVLRGEMEEFMMHLKKATHSYFDETKMVECENRRVLREIMESVGLVALEHEWWHYNLRDGKVDKYPLVELNKNDYE